LGMNLPVILNVPTTTLLLSLKSASHSPLFTRLRNARRLSRKLLPENPS
jgi:hypothetical protein